MKKETSAGCYLVRKNKEGIVELCTIYRHNNKDGYYYVLPKGHQENAESLETTALRETMEETGYQEIEVGEYLGSEEFLVDFVPCMKTVHWYLGFLKDEEKKVEIGATENEKKTFLDLVWKTPLEALELLRRRSPREVEEKFLSMIKSF